jgi:GNAT superfamily N-acetyltransferase
MEPPLAPSPLSLARVATTAPTSSPQVVFVQKAHWGDADAPQIPTVRLLEKSDEREMTTMLADFQDCLKEMDPEKRMKRDPDFGSQYLTLLLRDIEQHEGFVVVCALGQHLIGFGACIIVEPSEYDKLEYIDERIGRITELYVAPTHRRNGIGRKLISTMESLLRSKGCTRVELGVMHWNTDAHALYNKLGYADVHIRMAKPL